MIELERHIEILLLSNDCVIVPGLGGFMAHHVDARYDDGDHSFLPPLRTLGFNPQLTMNDSLLVQSYVEVYDTSYPEALRRIEAEVAELRQHLEADGQYELNDLGVLRLNEEGKMEFEPCEAGILTPGLYGLSSFEMLPLQQAGHSQQQALADTDGNAITIKMSWLRNAVAVAAAIIAFLMIGTPVSNSRMGSDVQQSAFIPLPSSQQPQQKVVEPTSGEADSLAITQEEDEAPASNEQAEQKEELPSEVASAPETPAYCIVLASQVTRPNAEEFIGRLSKQGFNEASIVEKKFIRIVYGNYPSEEEAHKHLRDLRSQSQAFKEAWVMKM